jgi:hypothetical protein
MEHHQEGWFLLNLLVPPHVISALLKTITIPLEEAVWRALQEM